MNNWILIALLFAGIFFIKLLWIITDKTPLRKTTKRDLIKSNLIEFSIIILQGLAAIFTPLPPTPYDFHIFILGIGMYILGLFFALWGRVSLNKTWGYPGRQMQDFQKSLVTHGAFTVSRNPIYVGFILLFFGYATTIRSWLIILRIPLLLYFYRSILSEEKLLTEQFGERYIDYKKRVPRFLLV